MEPTFDRSYDRSRVDIFWSEILAKVLNKFPPSTNANPLVSQFKGDDILLEPGLLSTTIAEVVPCSHKPTSRSVARGLMAYMKYSQPKGSGSGRFHAVYRIQSK